MEARLVAQIREHLWQVALELPPPGMDNLQINAQLVMAPVPQGSQEEFGTHSVMQVAGWTTTLSESPSVSTNRCRLRPVIFLALSKP